MKRTGLAFIAALCAAAAVVGAAGASAGSSDRSAQRPPGFAKTAKLASTLAQVAAAERATGGGDAKARSLGLDVRAGKVVVVVSPRADRKAAESAVTAAHGEVEATHAGLVQALVAPAALESLARSAAVAYVRPPQTPIPQAITGEEIAGSAANVFQTAGWSGAGVKVAIIDAGFAGLAARQANGDIPLGVVTQDMCGGGFSTATEHGAGVTEIVHEVAPQAQLYLICVDSEVTLGQAKDFVKANGVTIVNQSLAWLNAGRGDGSGGPATVDGIVADARANGILWVNSSGNYQQRHWSGNFDAGGGSSIIHDFAPGDERNTLSLNQGQQTCAFLKWDDWPASAQDYDLYLVRESTGQTVAGSTSFQTGSEPPTEAFCYTVPGGQSGNYGLEIELFDASAAPRFDLIVTFPNLEYRTPAGSIIEPASSPNAMAVGALCWADGSLRSYSSLGPTIDGRTKPDIAGLDGVSGGTYGAPAGCTGGFTGTSASSPHVAGLAALGKQQNPSLTPAQLQTWLEARALDVASPGKDDLTGAGRAFVYTFTDSPPWIPLQNYIEQLFKKGTTTGCTALNPSTGSRNYCPNDTVTRRDMAVFIIRSLGLTELFPAVPTFADVPASMFGWGFVERFYQQGITNGCAINPLRYCPLDNVTRRDMAVFIIRAKGLSELFPAVPTFADVPASMFGWGFVERFYEQGITTGCAVAPLRYCPLDFVDRKAMAAFLIRAFGPPS
jgi:subtilisin family serine protease